MYHFSLQRVFRRSVAATIAAVVAALPVVAAAAGFTLAAPTPATVTVGTKGMVIIHMKMTPPNAGTNPPTGFMTVIRQGDTDPIWCFPNAGTLCYTGSIVNGTVDVHVYMTKLAATTGILLFQLRDPKSSALYSNALPVPVRVNPFTSGGAVLNTGKGKTLDKTSVPLNKTAPVTPVPAASPKP
jgi:hypothetical protein